MKKLIIASAIFITTTSFVMGNEFEMDIPVKHFYENMSSNQIKCVNDKIDVKYIGQTSTYKDWMEIEITNNTNIPTAWVSIEVVQIDAKYGNVLDKNTVNKIFKNTLGPGEKTTEMFYGNVQEGRNIEVKAVNMRDLEGRRLVDDNTNYIGSIFPVEISNVYCK